MIKTWTVIIIINTILLADCSSIYSDINFKEQSSKDYMNMYPFISRGYSGYDTAEGFDRRGNNKRKLLSSFHGRMNLMRPTNHQRFLMQQGQARQLLPRRQFFPMRNEKAAIGLPLSSVKLTEDSSGSMRHDCDQNAYYNSLKAHKAYLQRVLANTGMRAEDKPNYEESLRGLPNMRKTAAGQFLAPLPIQNWGFTNNLYGNKYINDNKFALQSKAEKVLPQQRFAFTEIALPDNSNLWKVNYDNDSSLDYNLPANNENSDHNFDSLWNSNSSLGTLNKANFAGYKPKGNIPNSRENFFMKSADLQRMKNLPAKMNSRWQGLVPNARREQQIAWPNQAEIHSELTNFYRDDIGKHSSNMGMAAWQEEGNSLQNGRPLQNFQRASLKGKDNNNAKNGKTNKKKILKMKLQEDPDAFANRLKQSGLKQDWNDDEYDLKKEFIQTFGSVDPPNVPPIEFKDNLSLPFNPDNYPDLDESLYSNMSNNTSNYDPEIFKSATYTQMKPSSSKMKNLDSNLERQKVYQNEKFFKSLTKMKKPFRLTTGDNYQSTSKDSNGNNDFSNYKQPMNKMGCKIHTEGFSKGCSATDIASVAAIQAKSFRDYQDMAGKAASQAAYNELAEKAVRAAKAAEAILSGKSVMVYNMQNILNEAKRYIKVEGASCDKAEALANQACKLSKRARIQYKRLVQSLREAESILPVSRQTAYYVMQDYKDKVHRHRNFARHIHKLNCILQTARNDYECLKPVVFKAASAAAEARSRVSNKIVNPTFSQNDSLFPNLLFD